MEGKEDENLRRILLESECDNSNDLARRMAGAEDGSGPACVGPLCPPGQMGKEFHRVQRGSPRAGRVVNKISSHGALNALILMSLD